MGDKRGEREKGGCDLAQGVLCWLPCREAIDFKEGSPERTRKGREGVVLLD